MFGCGLDLVCHGQNAIAGTVDWLLSFVSFNSLVILWIGTAIGAQWGWPALIAETLGLAALVRRRQSPDDPTEHFDRHPDHALAPKPRPVRRPHPTLAEGLRKLFGRE